MTLATPSIKCPDPGVYPGVCSTEYHMWDAASASRLSVIHRQSALHMRHGIDHPAEPTASMRLGTALHMAVLEPRDYAYAYAVARQCEKKTAKGEQCSRGGKVLREDNWYCSQHDPRDGAVGGPVIQTPDEAASVFAMKQALLRHRAAGWLLLTDGPTELSIVWNDPDAGVRCKARIDKLVMEHGVALDLKAVSDASPDAFARSIDAYGYARQGSFYLHGLAANGLVCDSFVFGAVESEQPHAVGAYRLDDESLEVGRRQNAVALATYAECERLGRWTGYGDDIRDIQLPAWAMRREGL